MITEATSRTLGYAAGASPGGCLAACLITDAEHYTGLAEAMAPSAVVDLVNAYLAALFGPVLQNGGMVSDVKGDGLLAVWNQESGGEQFRARACSACLQILAAVDAFNRQHPHGALPTRLGADFGQVAIARVGAHEHFEYRAVGDPVNTASRLGELNKLLRTRVLVSEAFAQGVRGFLFRDLGSFHLRGKQGWTRVKELVGKKDQCTERQREHCDEFAAAVAAYENGKDLQARTRFRALQSCQPQDGATRYYLRCLDNEEAAGWLERAWGSA